MASGAMDDGVLLIVLHGPGRGRGGSFLQPFLDDLAVRNPHLFDRLRFHRTGNAKAEFDNVRGVLFYLGDPLRELYPDCYADAVEIANAARARGLPMVNAPESLSHSIKSIQARRFAQAGILSPEHHGFSDEEQLEALLAEVGFPAFVRSDLHHGQRGMALCETPADVRRRAAAGMLWYPGTLTPLVDTREGFRETRPESIWAALYHKKRAYLFGETVRSHHVLFSSSPMVARRVSTFSGHPQRLVRGVSKRLRQNGWPRLSQATAPLEGPSLRLQRWGRTSLDEDLRFWQAGEEHGDLLRRVGAALDLQILAIDYSDQADGTPVIWEANPYFSLRPTSYALGGPRQMERRLTGYYQILADLLADMAGVTR